MDPIVLDAYVVHRSRRMELSHQVVARVRDDELTYLQLLPETIVEAVDQRRHAFTCRGTDVEGIGLSIGSKTFTCVVEADERPLLPRDAVDFVIDRQDSFVIGPERLEHGQCGFGMFFS